MHNFVHLCFKLSYHELKTPFYTSHLMHYKFTSSCLYQKEYFPNFEHYKTFISDLD